LLTLYSVDVFGQNTITNKKIETNQISGKWKLIEYTFHKKPSKPKTLSSCDSAMIWNFYVETKTKKNVLKCMDAGNLCKDYFFESDWVLNGSNLMIRRTKIMGFGGISASGTFNIRVLTETKMILEFQKNTYHFQKI